jgi:hypothetical protein
MEIPVRLQELLQQPEPAILTISSLMGQELALLDCSNITSITPEQLNLIFTHIPQEWDYRELTEIFDTNTLTDTLINQLYQYIDQCLGRIPTLQITTSPLSTPDSFDIFNFRNKITGDYRRYIESF